ncbi:abc transporter related [Lacticaseibacillus brantae DSM 23927]|uniref:Abc transporter related n=1 Tax=Lacticaseibacillus brantae DSM 23927 TaxID=1423727 RepID=A0A0R2AY47_9LACO|nr:abc transporter related [Lacticaseibacillus brantae DSM 23927]
MIGGASIPAVVINLLTQPQVLPLVGIMALVAGLALASWFYDQNTTATLWGTIALRMQLSLKDAKTFLNLPYLVQTNPTIQAQRAESAKRGFEDDERGVGPFVTAGTQLLESCLIAVIIIVISLTLAWWIPGVLVGTIALTLVALYQLNQFRTQASAKLNQLYFRQNYFFETAFSSQASEDMRLFHFDGLMIQNIDKLQAEILGLERVVNRHQQLIELLISGISALRMLTVYGWLLWLTINGHQSVGQFTFYFVLLSTIEGLVRASSLALSEFLRANTDLTIGRQFIETYEGAEDSVLSPAITRQGLKVIFNHVSFSYGDQVIIDDLSFTIRSGESIALVGSNGAGKTTLTMLLMGMIRPTSGEIFFNDQSINNLTTAEILAYFSTMFQDNVIFAADVQQNVSVSRDPSVESVRQALSQAGLYDRIAALPDQEATEMTQYLSSDGVSLSGGETEKLMLARMVYHAAPMVILDEPTAALDALAESQLYQQIQHLVKGRTSLFISHRLASTGFADRIFFMRAGRIIAEGTHAQLLQTSSDYRALFNAQRQYYAEGGDQHA